MALMTEQKEQKSQYEPEIDAMSNNNRDPDTGERTGNFYGHKNNGDDSDARDENIF